MGKHYPPPFPPVERRRTATAEDVAARQTQEYSPPASPHRVGHTPGLHGEDAPYLSQQIIRPGRRQAVEYEEQDYADEPPKKQKTTSRIYRPAKPTRRLERTRFHWLVFVGLAMFIMIIGWLTFSALSSWWGVTQDDWHYGRPRTWQTDAVVGHGDSPRNPSHFIAMNLSGQILVMEVPGGNASKAQVYIGPRLFGAGEDLAPVTLSFEDRNGDGKPDLNIHIQGSDQLIVFLNDGTKFVPTKQQP